MTKNMIHTTVKLILVTAGRHNTAGKKNIMSCAAKKKTIQGLGP